MLDRVRNQIQPWKAIEFGGWTRRKYRNALKKAGFLINCDNAMLDSMVCGTTKSKVDLALVSVEELGFLEQEKPTYESICARAKDMGLELCPAETGPAVRLAFPEQPRCNWVFLGMKPVACSNDDSRIFVVYHNGSGRVLGGFPSTFIFRAIAENFFAFVACPA